MDAGAEIASETDCAFEADEDTDTSYNFQGPRVSRGRKNVLTQDLAQALDSSKLSNYQATKVLAAAATAFGADISKTNINFSSIRRRREEIRGSVAATIKENFKCDEVVTVHWDGKIVPALTGADKVDRMAVVATGITTNQLLGAPAITHVGKGKGKAIAGTVADLLKDWDIVQNTRAMSFDTTNENSGNYIFRFYCAFNGVHRVHHHFRLHRLEGWCGNLV